MITKRILLVDDDPTVRDSLSNVLVAEGYSVLPAENGQQALELANQLPVDLALLDLNMPRKSGRDVLGEIKSSEELKRIPVVVLTTSQSPHDLDFAYGLHANCYVVKPIDFDAFRQMSEDKREALMHNVMAGGVGPRLGGR